MKKLYLGSDTMDVNADAVFQLIMTALTILLGALSAYLKANEKLKNNSIKYITEAEEKYKDLSNAGGLKFTWVVDTLYKLVPKPLHMLITKSLIEQIVQSTFDEIESYAKTQIDKAVNKYLLNKADEPETTEDATE